MLYQIIFSIISFIFFSSSLSGGFSDIPLSKTVSANFEQGQIVKITESEYFSQAMLRVDYPEISASSAIIMDLRNDSFVFERDPDKVWPIASISKAMSALVLLEDFDIGWDSYYKIKESDRRFGGRDYLFLGDEVYLNDLLALALISSENTSVIAMISFLGLSEDDFVEKMNKKAEEMGLKNSAFFDATGLSSKNVSTAREVAIILKRALNNETIRGLVSESDYSFTTRQGKTRQIYSTNDLLKQSSDGLLKYNVKIIGGKTGYNDHSGYCLGTKFVLNNNQEFISVILNASSLRNRFVDTQKLLEKLAELNGK